MEIYAHVLLCMFETMTPSFIMQKYSSLYHKKLEMGGVGKLWRIIQSIPKNLLIIHENTLKDYLAQKIFKKPIHKKIM
jgi:hypothetical protein